MMMPTNTSSGDTEAAGIRYRSTAAGAVGRGGVASGDCSSRKYVIEYTQEVRNGHSEYHIGRS